ncbi:MAG TPA: TonB-dependent receptor, partial [Woeseiaceae bacterium]|nr:TonB-dependent receptor [Woeseiaceae bacterium]
AANRSSVLDVLRGVPGLQVTQPGGRGGVASVFIRGGEPNFTMVLLDGVRVNDPNNTRGGSFDFSTLSVGDIERIEIVRGPQSAIYGSDALSGVINIITRGGADELGASVQAEVGEDDYQRAGLSLAGPLAGNGGFALRAATTDDGEATPGNTYISDSIAGKLEFGSTDGAHVRLFGRYSDNEGTSFPEDSGGPELAVLRRLDSKSSTDVSAGVVGGLRLSESWRLNVSAGRYDHEDRYDSPGVAPGLRAPVPPNRGRSKLDRLSLSAHAVGDLTENLRATVGVDYHDEDGTSESFVEVFPGFSLPSGFELDRSVTGVFGELQYRATTELALLASLRHDDPDGETGETTTKLGAVYDLNEGRTTLRANWGEGFKLPSFFALGSALVGNPDLKPEKSESADLGVTQRIDRDLTATLTVYRNEFTDLIDFDFDLFTSVNRKSVTANGAELAIDWAVRSDLGLFAEVAYLDLDVKDSDVSLRQRPEWRGSAALRWHVTPDWKLDAEWLLVGETFDSSIPTDGLMLDGYNRLDATVTWRATERTDWLLSVDNLLDTEYAEAIGFPSPGRRARLALRYRF